MLDSSCHDLPCGVECCHIRGPLSSGLWDRLFVAVPTGILLAEGKLGVSLGLDSAVHAIGKALAGQWVGAQLTTASFGSPEPLVPDGP